MLTINSTRLPISSKRLPRFILDDNKNMVVQVPLSDNSVATVDCDTFRSFVEAEMTDQWFLNRNSDGTEYVRCRHEGRVKTVARLIVEAPEGSIVRHRNGDMRDLRTSNLKVIQKKERTNV